MKSYRVILFTVHTIAQHDMSEELINIFSVIIMSAGQLVNIFIDW